MIEVADDDQLDAWDTAMDALGVERSPIRDLGRSRFVSLEDIPIVVEDGEGLGVERSECL